MFDGGRLREFGDGLNPGGQWADPLGGEAMSQKIHLWAAEQALVAVDNEPVALKNGEDRLQVPPMGARIQAATRMSSR
jgi:hypothetical protein